MKKTTAVIVGAGQSGLAMSRALTELSVDHIVLDKGHAGHSWRTQRWDTLRMLTPNWANRLPGNSDIVADPDGYMRSSEFADTLSRYSRFISAPLLSECRVERVTGAPNGYLVETSHGPINSKALVVATGAASLPVVPALSNGIPRQVLQMASDRYRSPTDLPSGTILVVGASASGVQIARELQLAGRQVVLSVGNHMRLPRSYRGKDIEYWLDVSGILDERADDIAELSHARNLPSPQLMGGAIVDLNALQEIGVEIVGRLNALRDSVAFFSGGLEALTTSADLKMHRTLDMIDMVIPLSSPAERPERTRLPSKPRLSIQMNDGSISAVVWATGFRPDHSWLDLPVFDRRRHVIHDNGACPMPGLFVLGLPVLRRRRSHHISGTAGDTQHIGQVLRQSLDTIRAA